MKTYKDAWDELKKRILEKGGLWWASDIEHLMNNIENVIILKAEEEKLDE